MNSTDTRRMAGRTTGPDEIRVVVPRAVAKSRKGKILQRSRTAIIREARLQDPRTGTMGVQALSFPSSEPYSFVWFTSRYSAEDGLQ
jgi:hypothetical protein